MGGRRRRGYSDGGTSILLLPRSRRPSRVMLMLVLLMLLLLGGASWAPGVAAGRRRHAWRRVGTATKAQFIHQASGERNDFDGSRFGDGFSVTTAFPVARFHAFSTERRHGRTSQRGPGGVGSGAAAARGLPRPSRRVMTGVTSIVGGVTEGGRTDGSETAGPSRGQRGRRESPTRLQRKRSSRSTVVRVS